MDNLKKWRIYSCQNQEETKLFSKNKIKIKTFNNLNSKIKLFIFPNKYKKNMGRTKKLINQPENVVEELIDTYD